jgi:hypothetical protein
MSKLRQLGHKLTFFGNLLPRNQDQNLPLVFCKIWTSKIASNGRWLRDTVLLGEEEVVFTPREITGCGNETFTQTAVGSSETALFIPQTRDN